MTDLSSLESMAISIPNTGKPPPERELSFRGAPIFFTYDANIGPNSTAPSETRLPRGLRNLHENFAFRMCPSAHSTDPTTEVAHFQKVSTLPPPEQYLLKSGNPIGIFCRNPRGTSRSKACNP